jgi:hypothetical protein
MSSVGTPRLEGPFAEWVNFLAGSEARPTDVDCLQAKIAA